MKSILLDGLLKVFLPSVLIVGGFVLIVILYFESKRAKVRAVTDKVFAYLRRSEKITCDNVFIDCKAQNALAFNKNKTMLLRVIYDDFRKNVTYKLPKYEKVYSPSDIISVEIVSSKQTTTHHSGSEFKGWFSGASISVEDFKELAIKIVFNDDEFPLHLLTLVEPPYFVIDYNEIHSKKKTSKLGKAVANELMSFLEFMINKDKNIGSETSFDKINISEKVDNNLEIKQIPDSTQTKDNLFGRLKEITDLKKDGLITEEEFLALKKELFSKTR